MQSFSRDGVPVGGRHLRMTAVAGRRFLDAIGERPFTVSAEPNLPFFRRFERAFSSSSVFF